MPKIVCANCKKVHEKKDTENCPSCHADEKYAYNFQNSDKYLKEATQQVLNERKEHGLKGLIKGLQAIIINIEPDFLLGAAKEFNHFTGHSISSSFQNQKNECIVLKNNNSADIILQSRKNDHINPFQRFNIHSKTKHLPNTRLETFIFLTNNLEKYVEIQQSRGKQFLTNDIIHSDNYSFIQTIPSEYTGNSYGFINWKQHKGSYFSSNDENIELSIGTKKNQYTENIKHLDHTATRVQAQNRDAAIIEFMDLTNYNFDFAIYVRIFNSITNVARYTKNDFAMVFTSGVTPFLDKNTSGPTENFIHNYGPRTHHMAFHTEDIENTIRNLKQDKLEFLIDLVGSPPEGLKQIFTTPSETTLLVNEYIHRYGDFDGFFTKNNVTKLTESTKKQ